MLVYVLKTIKIGKKKTSDVGGYSKTIEFTGEVTKNL